MFKSGIFERGFGLTLTDRLLMLLDKITPSQETVKFIICCTLTTILLGSQIYLAGLGRFW